MTILLFYKSMIQTVKDLNSFADKVGTKTQGQLLSALIEKKEVINHNLATLIKHPVSDSKRFYL